MAGYDGYTSVNTTARQQWLGVSDAPQTISASFQTRLLQQSHRIIRPPIRNKNVLLPSTKGRVGLGGYIINDSNGDVARTGVQLTYAFHLIMDNTQLSFGLASKFFQYRIDAENLTFGKDFDEVANNLSNIGYVPDLDFGLYLTNSYYFIGLSVSNLFQSGVNIGSGSKEFQIDRHYWLLAGNRFIMTRELDLEPNILLKTTEKWIPQADIGVKLYYLQNYWAGLAFRTDGSIVSIVGIKRKSMVVGYAFDYSLGSVQRFNFGTHELSLSFKFGDDARRYRWLKRY